MTTTEKNESFSEAFSTYERDEIEKLLAGLPDGVVPTDIPVGELWRGLLRCHIHNNYLLAAILSEMRLFSALLIEQNDHFIRGEDG